MKRLHRFLVGVCIVTAVCFGSYALLAEEAQLPPSVEWVAHCRGPKHHDGQDIKCYQPHVIGRGPGQITALDWNRACRGPVHDRPLQDGRDTVEVTCYLPANIAAAPMSPPAPTSAPQVAPTPTPTPAPTTEPEGHDEPARDPEPAPPAPEIIAPPVPTEEAPSPTEELPPPAVEPPPPTATTAPTQVPPADNGTGQLWVVQPGQSIQAAVDQAQPGDTVQLSPGRYVQRVVTRSSDVHITGPREAVITGTGESRAIEVVHDGITISGLTLDGEYRGGDFTGRLVYVEGTPEDYVERFALINVDVRNCGGECVRLVRTNNSLIRGNSCAWAGRDDFPSMDRGKNGECVYIGTAPEQNNGSRDTSHGNVVQANTFETHGNECVDIKEDATGSRVENNTCTGQLDPESGGMGSRGSGNFFLNNIIWGNVGAGIRLGGDDDDDGINNTVTGNVIYDNAGGGIRVQRWPQGPICGNTTSDGGQVSAVGDAADQVQPSAPCGT